MCKEKGGKLLKKKRKNNAILLTLAANIDKYIKNCCLNQCVKSWKILASSPTHDKSEKTAQTKRKGDIIFFLFFHSTSYGTLVKFSISPFSFLLSEREREVGPTAAFLADIACWHISLRDFLACISPKCQTVGVSNRQDIHFPFQVQRYERRAVSITWPTNSQLSATVSNLPGHCQLSYPHHPPGH